MLRSSVDLPGAFFVAHDVANSRSWGNGLKGCIYRLPTEAEWEYACRAETTTTRFWGDDDSHAHCFANANDSTTAQLFGLDWASFAHDDGYRVSAPVGSFAPNPWGLYDMLGNVCEWCSDWFGESYYRDSPTRDPTGPTTGIERVVRGGTWLSSPHDLRASSRQRFPPQKGESVVGFRVAVTIPEE